MEQKKDNRKREQKKERVISFWVDEPSYNYLLEEKKKTGKKISETVRECLELVRFVRTNKTGEELILAIQRKNRKNWIKLYEAKPRQLAMQMIEDYQELNWVLVNDKLVVFIYKWLRNNDCLNLFHPAMADAMVKEIRELLKLTDPRKEFFENPIEVSDKLMSEITKEMQKNIAVASEPVIPDVEEIAKEVQVKIQTTPVEVTKKEDELNNKLDELFNKYKK
jgi:hypothetical protein